MSPFEHQFCITAAKDSLVHMFKYKQQCTQKKLFSLRDG